MDLLIPNSWLKKHLDTKATPIEFAKYMSLCGPSIERISKTDDGDYVYSIEVTTNRVDSASILGVAREATAILPRFGIKTKFKNSKTQNSETNYKFKSKVKYLDVTIDPKLCPRFTAVLIKNVTVKESPKEIRSLLEKVGVRPINNIVDVSNYIMHDIGQPVHTFDYDRISGAAMTLRESRSGERLITLDEKEIKFDGEDIVIEDGSGKLIDLCGIMGGLNSAIDSNTKNILLFVQNYNQHKIRKTSMSLNLRTEAAVLFEKGLDSENVKPAILSATNMIEKLSDGKAEKEILDIYSKPYKTKVVTATKVELDKIIGIEIPTKDILKYMNSLGFESSLQGLTLQFEVPSWRANDIEIKEDIAEEIARIYGYHNLPCKLMEGPLPKPKVNNQFKFEKEIKQILKSLGGIEVYNSSLVSKEMTDTHALQLLNPLGLDAEYLRTGLKKSLIIDIKNNTQEKDPIHMFEVANIYIPRKNNLPEEKLTLGGIIKDQSFRKNKGIVESLLDELNIKYTVKVEDAKDFFPNQRNAVYSNKLQIGEYGNLENKLFFYNFDIENLINCQKTNKKYKEFNKYPPQVEDLTLSIPEKTYIGEVISEIAQSSSLVTNVDLTEIYKNNYTFNIKYQATDHTLTDREVEAIRNKILKCLNDKFSITQN